MCFSETNTFVVFDFKQLIIFRLKENFFCGSKYFEAKNIMAVKFKFENITIACKF